MLHTKFQLHRSVSSGEEDFLFLIWSCGPNHLNNFSFKKDPGGVYEILFQSAQWFQSFQRRNRLKCWRTDGACLYYMLPRAFGSGELKSWKFKLLQNASQYITILFDVCKYMHYINACSPKVVRTQRSLSFLSFILFHVHHRNVKKRANFGR